MSLKRRRDLVGCLQAVGPSRMLFFCLCLWFSSHSCLTSVASLTENAGGWTRACVAHWPMLGLERDLGDLYDPSPASPRLCLKCTPPCTYLTLWSCIAQCALGQGPRVRRAVRSMLGSREVLLGTRVESGAEPTEEVLWYLSQKGDEPPKYPCEETGS